MSFRLNSIFFIVVLCFSLNSYCYIPSLPFLLSQGGKGHSYKTFSLEQDVVFNHTSPETIVHEKWLFKGLNHYELHISLSNNQISPVKSISYTSSKKVIEDTKGNTFLKELPPIWYMPLMTYANYFNVKEYLLKYKLVHADTFSNSIYKAPPDTQASPSVNATQQIVEIDNNSAHERDPRSNFSSPLTLELVNEIVSVVSKNSNNNSELWIDKDQYVINKVIFSDQANINFANFTRHGRNFLFPKESHIQWQDQIVTIQTKSLLQEKEKTFHLFPELLRKPTSTPQEIPQFFDDPIIEKFYTTFR